METPMVSADTLVHTLAGRHRVVLLGGMAIITHGLSRRTKDVAIWLEPMSSSEDWAMCLTATAAEFPCTRYWSLADRRDLKPEEVAEDIESFGGIRISGFDRDIDIFRRPHELGIESFEDVWSRAARILEGGVRLPDPLDLHISKANTGREHDWNDQLFLEILVKTKFRGRLPVCDFAEAKSMLDRFLDPQVLGYARTNRHDEVRVLVRGYLYEFEAEGDPYSRDILAEWKE